MSIAAMNWALRQRLESHQQQIILYVIADSADPDGVTRHCDPDYIAEHARMTRATMFRRLAEMETLGVLVRNKYYSERGRPIYEIRLNMAELFDVPIRGRRDVGDDEADQAAVDGPESQGATLVDNAPAGTKVAPVRHPQSHSCDSISPPVSKNLPPNPPPGGVRSKSEMELAEKRLALWERLRGAYPDIATMDQQLARDALDAMSIDDAEWAVSVVPAYKADIAKARKPPKNAHLWLRKQMFRNYPRGELRAVAAEPEGVWVAENSDEDRAIRFLRRLARLPPPFVGVRRDGARGYQHHRMVSADMLAMLQHERDVDLRWVAIERGTAQFAAWQERVATWVGRGVPVDHGATSIRMPAPWPPRRDGSWGAQAPSATPQMTADDADALAREAMR